MVGKWTIITIHNVDPLVDPLVLSSAVVDENGSVSVSGTFSDPGSLDLHEVVLDWGDGSTPTTVNLSVGERAFSTTHQYLDDNPTATSSDVYTITATVTDDDTGVASAFASIRVGNDAPVITSILSGAEQCGNAHEDTPITLSLTFADAGTLDAHDVVIDWGDGNLQTIYPTVGDRALSVNHDYAVGGIYTIVVTLTDDDTESNSESVLAVVSGVGLHDGALQIIGTSTADQVTLNQTGNGTLKVHADFIPETRDFPLVDVDRIFMLLCDGDDHATVSNRIALAALIDGGAGNDHLNGGGGPSVILGRSGNDHINGGSGRDVLIGGLGIDRVVGNPGRDLISGGVLRSTSSGATDTIADEVDLFAMLFRFRDATDAEIDDWRAGTDDFFTGFALELVDDDEPDTLTGSSAVDWFILFANDESTDAGSNGKGGGKKGKK